MIPVVDKGSSCKRAKKARPVIIARERSGEVNQQHSILLRLAEIKGSSETDVITGGVI
jgi:hypothetical protein